MKVLPFLIAYVKALLLLSLLPIVYILVTAPPPEPKKVNPIDLEIVKRAKLMKTMLTTDHMEETTTTSMISNLTQYLNDPTTRDLTVKQCIKNNLFDLTLDRVDFINLRCKELKFKRYIFYLVSFARELVVHGNETMFKCRMQTILNTMESCHDPQVDKLCLYLMVTAINTPTGGLCFRGAFKSLVALASKFPFGTIDWELASIAGIFADRVDKVAEVDREGICTLVERMLKYRAHWDDNLKSHFCWLYKNVECHAFDKANMAELLRDPVCIEFLKLAESVESDL
ncbi:hypothetical protein TVAG_264220 [Trichomonas vaginalis G3]|uniref:Uncharacterized protein n=1 Tax=Trichomonas vaginalis (strain ATCC PRA-98 / G3) TaxID=412133 RepID=A2FFL9_TRIV3|nr:hypothetical protein TVAGG3_1007950 [Trichomonas vaginalis G3]EAX96298.1 hypothetical protein TVAG_264220 [Trichomonas vaginalis G3]KAI5491267.1 hypothetical protein TVAGG3_1007950 [Trichomonas vaginalis G3]|eukprot:XP_001309228.1 hypothetical protein [Trichomonas vaginalis G3]